MNLGFFGRPATSPLFGVSREISICCACIFVGYYFVCLGFYITLVLLAVSVLRFGRLGLLIMTTEFSRRPFFINILQAYFLP